jgi:hypothetical protein
MCIDSVFILSCSTKEPIISVPLMITPAVMGVAVSRARVAVTPTNSRAARVAPSVPIVHLAADAGPEAELMDMGLDMLETDEMGSWRSVEAPRLGRCCEFGGPALERQYRYVCAR